MSNVYKVLTICLCLIIILLLLTQPAYSKSRFSAYKDLCKILKSLSGDTVNYHYMVYINLNACITCSEDLDSWHTLEEKLPECGGLFTFWASGDDSLDVAEGMRLEGFSTPVRVMDPEIIEALKLDECISPIKVLAKDDGDLIDVSSPASEEPKGEFEQKALKKICGDKK